MGVNKDCKEVDRKLMAWLPEKIKSLQIESPAYALFIWYEDFSGEPTPRFSVATTQYLAECRQLPRKSDIAHAVWRPGTLGMPGIPGIRQHDCVVVVEEIDRIYRCLGARIFDGLPALLWRARCIFFPEDAHEILALAPVSKTFQRIAMKLNVEVPWQDYCRLPMILSWSHYAGLEKMNSKISQEAFPRIGSKYSANDGNHISMSIARWV